MSCRCTVIRVISLLKIRVRPVGSGRSDEIAPNGRYTRTYATILPTVERQVRGHMRNRQQTVKPGRKMRIALTVGVSAYVCRRVRDQSRAGGVVLFADVGRTWRVSRFRLS